MQQTDGQVLIRAELDTSSVTQGIAEMKTALESLKTYASKQFAAIRIQAQTEGNTIQNWIPGLASRIISALTTALSGGGTTIGGGLRTALTAALGVGTEYAPTFSGVGTQVISGIIGGIRSSTSSLFTTLRNVAANMLSTLKSALGIQSPSRLMRDEVGVQIGAGIAQGMLDSRGAIASASQTLAADAASGMGVIQSGGTSGAAVRAAGGLLRNAFAASTASTAVQIPAASGAAGADTGKPTPVIGGSTFIFQKPVETPYRHAQAIRETMEEMLYGT